MGRGFLHSEQKQSGKTSIWKRKHPSFLYWPMLNSWLELQKHACGSNSKTAIWVRKYRCESWHTAVVRVADSASVWLLRRDNGGGPTPRASLQLGSIPSSHFNLQRRGESYRHQGQRWEQVEYLNERVEVKETFTLEQAIKFQRESRGISVPYLKPRRNVGMGVQRHAPAVLLGKGSGTYFTGGSVHSGNISPPRDSNLGPSSP